MTSGTITLDIRVAHEQMTPASPGKSHLPADGAGYLAYPPLMTNHIGVPDLRPRQALDSPENLIGVPATCRSPSRPTRPLTTWPSTGAIGGRRLPLHKGAGISWFRPAGTSYLFGKHVRKPEKLFYLSIETDAVGMAAFTDEGMKITVTTQVIENIRHHFRFDAFEGDLTPEVLVASEIRDREHEISPLRLAPYLDY
jgi:hypothetical protein